MNPPAPHPRLFRDRDADPSLLRGKTIAILGYGLLGQPLSLNLRDAVGTGANPATVIVGSDDEPSSARARVDGFEVLSLVEAAARADVALFPWPPAAAGRGRRQPTAIMAARERPTEHVDRPRSTLNPWLIPCVP